MQQLLLLHGAIGSKAQLEPLANLIEDQFEIHLLNFGGHGGSAITNDFSITQFAHEILAYLDANSIQKINVFGYSMGGYVAVYLAKNFPDRIEKIFALATKWEWSPEIAAREIKMLDPQKIEQKIPAFALELAKRHAPEDWKLVLNNTAHLMIALGESHLLTQEDFKQIQNPIRIALGDQDQMVSLEETIAIYRHLPNASLTVFSNTQHPIEKVNLKRLVLELRDFFGS